MAADALFALCVALNTWAIGYWMFPVLLRLSASLRRELERSRRYLRTRPTRLRERALRRRSLRAAGCIAGIMLALLLVALLYAPSVIFAGVLRADALASLFSIEAGIGMLAGSLAWYRWRRRS
ncbi:MAG: hypothetical protein QNJ85_12855 [Gammaproteobacteria bacterium]|nr:hypothetical protein [Gammaproteobacteria bacterium]